MTADEIKKMKRRVYKKTKVNMEKIGTFKAEFDPTVQRYAELRAQYEALSDQWYEDGCQITESYTNKAGATNQRKTALYLALETMRKELTDIEMILGLTPRGLKQIKAKGLESKEKSALDAALEKMGNGI